MKEIELLESELKLMLDNINRLKQFVKEEKSEKYRRSYSVVFGELKHRGIAVKNRITIVGKIPTLNLF